MQMKNILFDYVTFEDAYINGGALTAKSILFDLVKRDCRIVGLCRDRQKVNKDICIFSAEHDIPIVELKEGLSQLIAQYHIDRFFIGIGQRYAQIPLDEVSCRIDIIIHDIGDLCMYNADMLYRSDDHLQLLRLKKRSLPKLRYFKMLLGKVLLERSLIGQKLSRQRQIVKFGYANIAALLRRDNVYAITVSEYSRNAIEYYFEQIANPIKVFYPYPTVRKQDADAEIRIPVQEYGEYFLMLSADRYNKNVSLFLRQFDALNGRYSNRFKAVIVGFEDLGQENIIGLPQVSDEELKVLQSHCFALVYASFSEGFGLIPLEVMRYGKPALCAYSTSIPEIYGNSVLYFNPAYPEDLFLKETILIENYEQYCAHVKEYAETIVQRQDEDGKRLLDYILT